MEEKNQKEGKEGKSNLDEINFEIEEISGNVPEPEVVADSAEKEIEKEEEPKFQKNKENSEEEKERKREKRMKDIISLVILLTGLFLGSLFVDISQVIKGSGYSAKNLNKSEIFEADGKTWVAYDEPAVPITVISDDDCEKCDPSEVLVWLRRVMPTVSTKKVSYNSAEGKTLIDEFGIKTLPAFVFDKDLEKTDFYTQANVLFALKNDQYVMNTQELGVPTGKYLELPRINDDDATFGNKDANVKIVVFSDFQCPYCNVFYQSLRQVMKDYQDKIYVAFKELPLEIHAQANDAALASECAWEQGKFWEYADKLYSKQSEWGNSSDIAKLKTYATQLGLNSGQFKKCLDDKKYQSKIDTAKEEAGNFGISGTPTVFINDQVQSGVISAEQLKQIIDEELAK